MKKTLVRFLLGDPLGQAADGRAMGVGLSAALRKHYSADDAERYLRDWSTEHSTEHSTGHSPEHPTGHSPGHDVRRSPKG
ncbi:hypothetical protein [Nonomuraea sp. SBT364]|uniref:hypothetical protein n=1 Tax=Nonomuraea sp. SBT364 TaxID=1580530 RepID=UPI000A3FD96C|nr:hypothetical protein [Nonomuraea sp. SBT364]